MIIILDTWMILDRWWLFESEQIKREFAEVDWDGCRFIFKREAPDTIWRIFDRIIK
jgi:hypothetical protein